MFFNEFRPVDVERRAATVEKTIFIRRDRLGGKEPMIDGQLLFLLIGEQTGVVLLLRKELYNWRRLAASFGDRKKGRRRREKAERRKLIECDGCESYR